MTSFATKSIVSELARHLSELIPQLAEQAESTGDWTDAVYNAFAEFIRAKPDWNIYPKDRAKKGEYLCDFMLFEKRYGPRVACECQWWHNAYFGEHFDKLDWSFDKLRGVKADVKVFIFEGESKDWEKIWRKYLTNYALLSPDEAFLVLKFEHDVFRSWWWKPSRPGVHTEDEITFAPIDLPANSSLL